MDSDSDRDSNSDIAALKLRIMVRTGGKRRQGPRHDTQQQKTPSTSERPSAAVGSVVWQATQRRALLEAGKEAGNGKRREKASTSDEGATMEQPVSSSIINEVASAASLPVSGVSHSQPFHNTQDTLQSEELDIEATSSSSTDAVAELNVADPVAAHRVVEEMAVVVGFGDDKVELQTEEEYEKEKQWSKQRRRCIGVSVVILCLLVGGIVAVVAVFASSGSTSEVLATPAPTTSPSPTQSSSDKPSIPPTNSPTAFPSTATPTTSPRECFQTLFDLQTAVDQYVEDRGSNTAIAAKYGWPIGVWCTGQITSLQDLFSTERNPAMADFNEDISGWNVSRVFTMESAFLGAKAFNQNISGWDVSQVTSFESCFEDAESFDQPLDNWDVSSATTFKSFFRGARAFGATTTQDLTGWQTSLVTNMHFCFATARNFTGDISSWDVARVVTMDRMFSVALQFNSDLSEWEVSRVTDMTRMFKFAEAFDSNISGWDVSRVRDMAEMFSNAKSFNHDISGWDMSSVIDTTAMFNRSESFRQDLCSWGSAESGRGLPPATGESMFVGSACDHTESPDYSLTPPGPFCFACDN